MGSRFAGSKFGGTRRVNVELLIESVNIAAELAYHSHRVLTKCVEGVGSGWVGEVTEAALSAQIIDATGGFASDLNMRGGAGVVRVSATSGVRAYGDVDMSAPIPVLSVFAVKLQTPAAAAAVGESAASAGGYGAQERGMVSCHSAIRPTPHADVILPIPLFLSSSEEDRSSFGTDPTLEH
ncbi:unnamed protein product, partial [Closterium sp. NIES-65]